MLKILALSALGLFMHAGHAQSGTVRLGAIQVTDDASRFALNTNACGVSRISLAVQNGRTHINNVVVEYRADNARNTRYRINRTYRNGENTGWLDLPGNARCVTRVIVNGRSTAVDGRSRLIVYGFRANNDNRGARVIGQAALSEGTTLRWGIARNACNLNQLRVRVLNDSASIQYLSVRFTNGTSQRINIRQNFRRGSTSTWKDLSGANRCIQSFFVWGRSGSRPENAIVQLIGR